MIEIVPYNDDIYYFALDVFKALYNYDKFEALTPITFETVIDGEESLLEFYDVTNFRKDGQNICQVNIYLPSILYSEFESIENKADSFLFRNREYVLSKNWCYKLECYPDGTPKGCAITELQDLIDKYYRNLKISCQVQNGISTYALVVS